MFFTGLRKTIWARKWKRSHQSCVSVAARSIMLKDQHLTSACFILRGRCRKSRIEIRWLKCQFDCVRPTVSHRFLETERREQWKRSISCLAVSRNPGSAQTFSITDAHTNGDDRKYGTLKVKVGGKTELRTETRQHSARSFVPSMVVISMLRHREGSISTLPPYLRAALWWPPAAAARS